MENLGKNKKPFFKKLLIGMRCKICFTIIVLAAFFAIFYVSFFCVPHIEIKKNVVVVSDAKRRGFFGINNENIVPGLHFEVRFPISRFPMVLKKTHVEANITMSGY